MKDSIKDTDVVVRLCGVSGIDIKDDDLENGRLNQWSVYVGPNENTARSYARAAKLSYVACALNTAKNIMDKQGQLLKDDKPIYKGHYILNNLRKEDAKNLFSRVINPV
jgi:hypothetical protein